MEKVRLGVIGCGGIVEGAHIRAIQDEMEKGRLEVTAVCEIIPERAERAAKLWNCDYITDDWTTIVGRVDAILCALPHDLHHACGKFFLENGVHVMMEKPLANTEPECIDLIETAERTGKILMVAYPWRYEDGPKVLKKLLDEETYGKCFQVSMWTEQYTYLKEGNWGREAKRLGGGQFFSHGCHYIDWLLWFFGRPKRGIHFGTNLGTEWMEKEGTSQAMIEFENGMLAYHGGTWGAQGTRLGYGFHFHCTKGMIEYDHFTGKIYAHTGLADHIPGSDGANEKCELIYEHESGKNLVPEMNHFLDCVLYGEKPITTAEDSLQGLRVIWKMYEAERDNTIADLTGLGLEDDWKAVPLTEHGVWEEWE